MPGRFLGPQVLKQPLGAVAGSSGGQAAAPPAARSGVVSSNPRTSRPCFSLLRSISDVMIFWPASCATACAQSGDTRPVSLVCALIVVEMQKGMEEELHQERSYRQRLATMA